MKGEPIRIPVEEHVENPIKETKVRVYERITRRHQRLMLEEEQEKCTRTKNEKIKHKMQTGDEEMEIEPRV